MDLQLITLRSTDPRRPASGHATGVVYVDNEARRVKKRNTKISKTVIISDKSRIKVKCS